MTSPSLRNRPTTACARRRGARTLTSAFAALLWLAGSVPADQFLPPTRPETHTYHKVPGEAPGEVEPVVFQAVPPAPGGGVGPDTRAGYQIQLEVPGSDRVFRLESEAALFERMRQEARDRNPSERITFPEEPNLSNEVYQGRAWPALKTIVEPSYVCYRKLLFEQKNFERAGWDLGAITPLVSGTKFFWDVFWLPYHVGTDCFRKYECNTCYCLPDDPSPLLLYPPEWSLTGALLEIGTVATMFVIFP